MICYSSERLESKFLFLNLGWPFWPFWPREYGGSELTNFQSWVMRSSESFASASWGTYSQSPDRSETCGSHIRDQAKLPETHGETEGLGQAHSASQSCQGTTHVNEAAWTPQASAIASGTPGGGMFSPWYPEHLP